MELKGKVALVTGSTSGIGLGIARVLAAAGADVALNGFGDAAAVEALRAEMAAEFGVNCGFYAADISDPAAGAAMVDAVAGTLGGPDILVNNAGIQFTAPIEDFPVETWNQVLAINLSGAFYLMRAALPLMRARGWGRVVNIASAHGLVASTRKAAYVAAKHGIMGLTKVAGLEYANTGVTVNAVNPGWVLTPLVEAQIAARAQANGTTPAQESAAMLGEKQEMLRFSTPGHIGAAVRFLCSDGAETITGTAITVDGGWTAR
ncbi:MAG: 3-hydroxybutyrate dehydrogenase [Rubritepida sp.]|jgi:3-hydroxybutyrate dehydrogenase|nr:3-hydroxybutyrate dehydrogenase [Rubritepida sp.]